MIKYLLPAIFLAFYLQPASAEEASVPVFRIAIEVTVADEDLRKRVEMYLRNELRGLGDVEVTDASPDFKLFAMVTEIKTGGGGRIAYVLGTTITSFFPDGYVDSIISARLRNIQEVAQKLNALAVYENQFISVAGATEAGLIKTVSNSVANIDTHILQVRRNTD